MTHLKTIAVSLVALAAIAIPATALDHRDHRRNKITYGVDLNFGAVRISNYSPRYSHRRAQPVRVYIALETGHHRDMRRLNRFQSNIRGQFARAAQGDFRLVNNPRRADIVIRLDQGEWGKAYRHYTKASRKGRYDRADNAIYRVAARLLDRAYDIRGKDYRNVRYDRYEQRGRHHDDGYGNRRNAAYIQYRN